MKIQNILTLFFSLLLFSCTITSENDADNSFAQYDLALGQWSFHKELFDGTMTTEDFIYFADTMGFWGVELVNQFFADSINSKDYFIHLQKLADSLGIVNASLLVDKAGELGASDKTLRDSAIEIHKKWIDAATLLGCATVRVNAHGDGIPEEIMKNCVSSFSELASYADDKDVYLLVENHGGISSNGSWLLNLIQELSLDPVGIMLDADNWCYEREGGDLWEGKCINEFDRYKGMEMLLPFAHSISLKGKDFDNEGNETTIDYAAISTLAKSAKYEGYIAIEYEGKKISSKEGVEKILALIKNSEKD